jgi:hypothetical protein
MKDPAWTNKPNRAWTVPQHLESQIASEWQGAMTLSTNCETYIANQPAADGSALLVCSHRLAAHFGITHCQCLPQGENNS